MQRGFFGAFVVLVGIGIFLSCFSAFSESVAAKNSAEYGALSVSDASFERASSEIFFDSIIEIELSRPVFPVVADEVEQRVNSALLRAFSERGLEPFLCSKTASGFEKQKPLDIISMNAVSGVFVSAESGIAVVSYFVAGSLFEPLFPCAEISKGDYSVFVALPIGYHAESLVVLP